MVKYADNINEIVDVIYYPAKICGIAPFKKVTDSKNVRYYDVDPFAPKHFFLNGGAALFIFLTAAVRVGNEIFTKKVELADFIVGACYIIFQCFSIATILHFILKQEHFIRSIKLIESLGDLFREIDRPLSFKGLHIACVFIMFGIIPFYLFCVLTPMWDLIRVLQNEPFCSFMCVNYISQLLNLLPAFVVRHIPYFFFTSTLYLTWQSFKQLKTYIKMVEHHHSNDFLTVKRAMSFYSRLHNLIFHLIKEINSAFMLPILFNISITFLELIAIIVSAKYTNNLTIYQATLGFTIYGSELLILLVMCQLVQCQINRINRLESELTLPYFSVDLSKKRQSLLLQMTHETIILTANGFYNLDMGVITAHIGLILTILMFFLKLRRDHEK